LEIDSTDESVILEEEEHPKKRNPSVETRIQSKRISTLRVLNIIAAIE